MVMERREKKINEQRITQRGQWCGNNEDGVYLQPFKVLHAVVVNQSSTLVLQALVLDMKTQFSLDHKPHWVNSHQPLLHSPTFFTGWFL